MQGHDVYLLSPELALAGVAVLVLGLDLVLRRKGWLGIFSAIGLLVPIGLTVLLWVDPGDRVANDPTGPFGTLLIDRYALFFKVLVLAILGAIVLASTDYARKLGRFQGEYYTLLMLAATGMMLLAAASELITIYVSLELATLPLAALAAFGGESRSSEAGMKFLILGAISSAVLLYGMALIFGFTGSTYLVEIAPVLRQPAHPSLAANRGSRCPAAKFSPPTLARPTLSTPVIHTTTNTAPIGWAICLRGRVRWRRRCCVRSNPTVSTCASWYFSIPKLPGSTHTQIESSTSP